MAKLGDRATFAGLTWIREEDYATLLTIFEDGDQFAGGWKEWEQRARKVQSELEAKGLICERAYIDPDTFADWCIRHGVGTGRDGRLTYGAEFIARKAGRHN
jgi:hypothetical protein